MIPLETFPLAEWHEGELADVPSFTVLKTQICVTRPQCVNMEDIGTNKVKFSNKVGAYKHFSSPPVSSFLLLFLYGSPLFISAPSHSLLNVSEHKLNSHRIFIMEVPIYSSSFF